MSFPLALPTIFIPFGGGGNSSSKRTFSAISFPFGGIWFCFSYKHRITKWQ